MSSSSSRTDREKQTIEIMIDIYCKGHGHQGHSENKKLCEDCAELLAYSMTKLDMCPLGDEKTSCRKCAAHCYEPSDRKKVQEVMRYSGPKMLLRYPATTLYHWRHESRKLKLEEK